MKPRLTRRSLLKHGGSSLAFASAGLPIPPLGSGEQGRDLSRSPLTQGHAGTGRLFKAGLWRLEFAGLKTPGVLARAQALICDREPAFDFERVSLDEPSAYGALQDEPVRSLLRADVPSKDHMPPFAALWCCDRLWHDFQPERFEHLMALVASVRVYPNRCTQSSAKDGRREAAILAIWTDAYAARRHGGEAVDYADPALEAILADTYGLILYQEQIMRIAHDLAGYSLEDADLLRRALGMKKDMDHHRGLFVTGAASNGISRPAANRIFDHMFEVAGYAWPKAFIVTQATLAYWLAYVRANYPEELREALHLVWCTPA